MQAGQLRHLLTIIAPAGQTQDAAGDVTTNWAPLGMAWGRVTPTAGRNLALGQIPTTNPTATHEIELRHLAGLTPECRIEYAGRIFALNSVRNVDERNIRQVCVATEVV